MPKRLANPETVESNGMLCRYLPSAEIGVDIENRTVDFSFSSTRPVTRFFWWDDEVPDGASFEFEEVLSHDAKHWRLERVERNTCPFLKNHNRSSKLGQVKSVSFEGDRGFSSVKLRRTQQANEFLADIEDGTAGGVSFGYIVHKYRVITPAEYEGEGWERRLKKKAVLEGVDIELLEISSEEIPADPSVGFDRSLINLRGIAIDGNPGFDLEPAASKKTSIEAPPAPPKNPKTPKRPGEKMKTKADFLTLDHEELAERAAELSRSLDSEKSEKQSLQSDLGQRESVISELRSEIAERDSKVESLDRQIEKLQRQEKVRSLYFSLRSRAEGLVNDAKLTAVEFEKYFSGDSTADIEKLCNNERAEVRLEVMAELIDLAGLRAPVLQTKLATDSEPIATSQAAKPESPTGQSADDYARSLLSSLYPSAK